LTQDGEIKNFHLSPFLWRSIKFFAFLFSKTSFLRARPLPTKLLSPHQAGPYAQLQDFSDGGLRFDSFLFSESYLPFFSYDSGAQSRAATLLPLVCRPKKPFFLRSPFPLVGAIQCQEKEVGGFFFPLSPS